MKTVISLQQQIKEQMDFLSRIAKVDHSFEQTLQLISRLAEENRTINHDLEVLTNITIKLEEKLERMETHQN